MINVEKAVNSENLISLGVSEEFWYDLLYSENCTARIKSFKKRYFSREKLLDRISGQYAFSPACFKGDYRSKSNFESAQLMVLTFEENIQFEELLRDDFIAHYAFYIDHILVEDESICWQKDKPMDKAKYRTRVIFILSEPMTDRHQYELMHQGLTLIYRKYRPHITDSPATEFFYGQGLHLNQYNSTTLLPIESAQKLITIAQKPPGTDPTAGLSASIVELMFGQPNDSLYISNLQTDILKRLNVTACNEAGRSNQIACVFHAHTDDQVKPEAWWNYHRHIFECKKCNKSWSALETAIILDLPISDSLNPKFNWCQTEGWGTYLPPREILLSGLKSNDDLGNEERFANHYGDRIRFCNERNMWLLFNGRYWEWVFDETMLGYAKANAYFLRNDEYYVSGDRAEIACRNHAQTSNSSDRLKAVLDIAKANPELQVSLAELDLNKNFISFENGTLDLMNGNLYPHDSNDLITQYYPVIYQEKDWATLQKYGPDFLLMRLSPEYVHL
jgi:hypothetical protein